MSGIGVGDDERAEVDRWCGQSLRFVHLGAGEMLVLVGGEERTYQSGRLVGHLAEGVARKVWTWVLGLGPLRRRRPAAEIDGFDSLPLHHYGLAR